MGFSPVPCRCTSPPAPGSQALSWLGKAQRSQPALIAADKNKGIVHGGRDITTSLNPSDKLPGLDGEDMRKALRTPSLPPSKAGLPRAPLPRLPGLDGRPKAPQVEVQQPGFGSATPQIPPMTMLRPAPAAAAAPAAPAETIAPKVETGAIENLHARADELR